MTATTHAQDASVYPFTLSYTAQIPFFFSAFRVPLLTVKSFQNERQPY